MAPKKNKEILDDIIVFISFLNTIWHHAIYKLTLKSKRTILSILALITSQ